MSSPCLLEALGAVPDPRSRKGRSYPWTPILALLVVGILMGRRSPAAIVQLTDDYGPEFALLLGFPRLKVPTASMLSKLLPRIDVTTLEAVLSAWIAALSSPATDPAQPADPPPDPLVVNIDGKCSRGSARRSAGLPGVHLLAAFAPSLQAVLAQLRVDAKTNEHKAALELLNILPRRPGGYIFTGDAIFTQTEVCQAIRDRDDDYVLVVKDNQPALAIDIEAGLTFVAVAATFSP
jgi:DDE_Tnp_1-associated/Transposase DDE domain